MKPTFRHRRPERKMRQIAMNSNTFVHCPTLERPQSGIQGSKFKVRCSDVRSLHPLFPCLRTDLEYDSRRWCRAFAFPSHAGNRRCTGRPTEAHEDMFTGPQHTLTLRSNLRFPRVMPTEADACRKRPIAGACYVKNTSPIWATTT